MGIEKLCTNPTTRLHYYNRVASDYCTFFMTWILCYIIDNIPSPPSSFLDLFGMGIEVKG